MRLATIAALYIEDRQEPLFEWTKDLLKRHFIKSVRVKITESKKNTDRLQKEEIGKLSLR